MISTKHWKSYYQDNLVLRVITRDNKMFAQGKRLPAAASDSFKAIQKTYVKKGAISAIRLIRDTEGSSLKDSLKAFDVLRGKTHFSWTHMEGR